MDCSSSNLGSRATGKTLTRIYNVFFQTIWNIFFHAFFWKVDIGQTAGLFASRYPQAALSVTTRREMQALCETGECQKNCLFITLFAPYIYIYIFAMATSQALNLLLGYKKDVALADTSQNLGSLPNIATKDRPMMCLTPGSQLTILREIRVGTNWISWLWIFSWQS